MRKYNSVIMLTAVLCLAAILLSGCAAKQTDTHTVTPAAGSETAAPTAAASPETVPDVSPIPSPDSQNTAAASPEPMADANSIPAQDSQNKGEIYDILADAYENFHFGTAGSSLTGMRLSASLMDWGIANGVEAVRAGAAEYDLGEKDEFDESLCVKLIDMMYYAVNMTADALDCAGYEARYALPYAVLDINAIYGAVFEARGWEPMNIMRVYRSDDNAERFLYSGIFTDGDAVNAETLNYVLWHDVPADGAAIIDFASDGETAYVNMNERFAENVRKLGTSGEYMMLGCLVNTILDNTGCRYVVLTVDGEWLETGHNIYDYPLSFFADNIGQ